MGHTWEVVVEDDAGDTLTHGVYGYESDARHVASMLNDTLFPVKKTRKAFVVRCTEDKTDD